MEKRQPRTTPGRAPWSTSELYSRQRKSLAVRVPRRLGLQSLNLKIFVLPGVGWATGSGSAPGRGESQGEVRTGDAIGAEHMGGGSSCGPQAMRVNKQRTGALRLSPELKERGGCRTLEMEAK